MSFIVVKAKAKEKREKRVGEGRRKGKIKREKNNSVPEFKVQMILCLSSYLTSRKTEMQFQEM